MARVGWIFSLVRSGSSAAAYACAHAHDLRVADEPFGPWDRTAPPYDMPPIQRDLVRAFVAVGHTLNAEIVGMANELFRTLAQRDDLGRVVCKCPHLLFEPAEFETWFAGGSADVTHRCVYLIRNPLHRINSAYARSWERLLNDPTELEVFRTFLHRWNRAEHRFRFDDMLTKPKEFFAQMHRAFAFGNDPEAAARSARYAATHYHVSSAATSDHRGNDPISQRRWAVPPGIADAYLAYDEIRAFMQSQRWPLRHSAYQGRPWATLLRTLRAT